MVLSQPAAFLMPLIDSTRGRRCSLDHPEALTRWQPKVHGYKKEDWEEELALRQSLGGLTLDYGSSEAEDSSRSPSPGRRRNNDQPPPVPASGWWEAEQVCRPVRPRGSVA